MGKMKDKFTEEQERLVNEAVEAFMDDDYQYQEYLNSLAERSCSSVNLSFILPILISF